MARRKEHRGDVRDDEVLGALSRGGARLSLQHEELLRDEGLGTFGHIMTRAVDLLGTAQVGAGSARTSVTRALF